MKKKIVVVGAGLAGLSAAINIAQQGSHVQLVSLNASERAQSVMAEGGINGALNTKGENDSPHEHYLDTYKAACEIVDPQAVKALTETAPKIIESLNQIGVPFNQTEDGKIDLRNFGGQKKKRTAYIKSETGKQIMTSLIDQARKFEVSGQIERFPHHAFETLLLNDNICTGCIIRNIYTNEKTVLEADAVIIASGGLNGFFGDTTGSIENTGDVTTRLFQLGVPLSNLEFIQYHPTTAKVAGKRMLLSEAARGEGGRLFVNRNGERWYFMEEKYPELKNLMPRDITSREVWNAQKYGQVYLDISELPEEVLNYKLIELLEDCELFLGIDASSEPIPIFPGIHYCMGGIKVDGNHRTAFKNLYAAGECSAQYHGANRLGGNSLLGAIYGGYIASQTALNEANGLEHKGTPIYSFTPVSRENLNQMTSLLLESLGVIRDGKTMEQALKTLSKLEGAEVDLARAFLHSAISRKESRGSHYREDFPERDDDNYKKTTTATLENGEIKIIFDEN